jgi:protein-tyrosine phosphatase
VTGKTPTIAGRRGLLKPILRALIPKHLLAKREVYYHLEPESRHIYLRLLATRWLGVSASNRHHAPKAIHSVLFLCFGNIMRSAVAGAMLKQALAQQGIAGIAVSSAGIHAAEGREAHPWAVEAAKDFGIRLEDHQAKLLTADMFGAADVVFVMDFQNKAELLAKFPTAADKICMLSAYATGHLRNHEIADPYYADLKQTHSCFSLIHSCIINFVSSLSTSMPAAAPRPASNVLAAEADEGWRR